MIIQSQTHTLSEMKPRCSIIKTTFLALLLQLALYASPLAAQAPLNPEFEHLTIDQGLPGRYVRAVAQDSKGFIWAGVSMGLCRYDGYTVKTYRFAQNDSSQILAISRILVDKNDNLWLGSFGNGLKYFEPKTGQFTHYRHDPNDPNSLSGNAIQAIYEDRQGNLWLATYGTGLNKLDREKNHFIRYLHKPGDPTSLSDNRVNRIFEDSKNNLWVCTDNGLNRFDPKTATFSQLHIRPDRGNGQLMDELSINDINEDSKGHLWICTYGGGLIQYDGQTFTQYQAAPNALSSNNLIRIFPAQPKGWWITTNKDGLNFLDIENQQFTVYHSDPTDPGSINANRVSAVLSDHEDNLWLGTNQGLDRLKVTYQPFITYQQNNKLSTNRISSVLVDQQGMIWFADREGGLTRMNPDSGHMDIFQHDANDPNSLSSNRITWLITDQNNKLWVGTEAGLNYYDRATGKFTNYRHDPNDPSSLSKDLITYISRDRSGFIWVGTTMGLNRFDPDKQRFKRFIYQPNAIDVGSENSVFSPSVEDAEGNIWTAYYQKGISRLDPQTGEFKRFRHDPADPNTISNDLVTGIVLDKNGDLLVQSPTGLDRLSLQPGNDPPFQVKRNLVSVPVHSILPDRAGNIWLGGVHGLIKYNPTTGAVRKYDTVDGLPTNQFNVGAVEDPNTGILYFATDKGLLSFHPDSLRDNPHIPPIAFTALYYFDNKDETGTPIEVANISYHEEVKFPYYQNNLLIEFAALSYNKTQKNQYAYKIEGKNNNWKQLGTEHRLNLTNLEPGTYPLRVKGSNGDGIWNEEGVLLTITIRPPWWETNWAKAAYVLIGLLLIAGFIRWRTFALRKRQTELENTVEERTIEIREKNTQLEETLDHLQTTQQQLIQQEKMASLGQMTAGIAHEIKNPLNFVNNLAEVSVELADELKEELERYQNAIDAEDYEIIQEVLEGLQKNANFIQENGRRADGIISSMMDHANDNQGERRSTDLNALVKEHLQLAYHGYKGDRENFEITFEENFDATLSPIVVNPQEIGRVLINLINNACYAVDEKTKTAGEGYQPTIQLSTRKIEEQLEIRIRDNGIGIPPDIRDKVFNPFFTTKPTGQGSTGLGLSISYDIVVQGHQGSLTCESEEGEYTEFVLTLPVS